MKRLANPGGRLIIFVLIALLTACSGRPAKTVVGSPRGTITAAVYADGNRLSYSVEYQGKTIVEPSAMGITVDHRDLGKGVEIGAPEITVTDEQYPWTGVHAIAHNHYREAVFPVTHTASGIRYRLELKVFDDGIAFRYVVPAKGVSLVQGEASSWRIPEGAVVWCQENIFYYEGLYYRYPVATLGSKRIGPPLTYQTKDSLYASITEAALYDYSGMSLQSDSQAVLHAAFVNDPQGWKIRDTIVTPWRVLIAGSTLDELVNSDIIPDLNPAPGNDLRKADWIRPGRAVWTYFMHDNVTSLALEKSYVQKAELLGFDYSVVDAGWEWSWPAAMDSLRNLVEYARPKKVGIWVWKSYPSLITDSVRRAFFKALHEAGVAGVKIDFIDTEGIKQVRFYKKALEDAAGAKLMIDFHGANKPTGYNRTFPNELTREGIYGQEWRTYNPQGPANNATIPFTRFLAGPGDYTPGVFNSAKAYGTSRAQQLALPIIYNSPLACWPEDPAVYLSSPALPIIKAIPTTWDETRVLEPSRIGKLAVFARRKGPDWFIGVANAGGEKRLTLTLGFLGTGKYRADLVQDDLTNPDSFLYTKTACSRGDSLLVQMRSAGGFVAVLRKDPADTVALSISPQGGYLTAPVAVSMKTDSGFSIRYTTDGREPSLPSTRYTQPVLINNSALISAAAFRQDKSVAAKTVVQFLAAPGPKISVSEGIFMNSITVRLDGGSQSGTIRYSLDGTEPGAESPIYRDSLVLTRTSVIKARTLYPSGLGSAVTRASFTRVSPTASVPGLNNIVSGLRATYYEGEWKQMPDFRKISGTKTVAVNAPDLLQLQTRKNNYALQFSGFIRIPETGLYTFYINSDDGSQLYLDGQRLIDNDGCHGDLEKSGNKALSAGMHRFTVNYFQQASGQNLQLYMSAKGMEKQLVPQSLLFHSGF